VLRGTTQTDGHAAAGLEAGADSRWQARPGLAGAIRLLALCGPVGLSAAVVYVTSRLVEPPAGSTALYVAWLVALSAAGTLSLLVLGRLSRRLLPLATLMRLSLLFPDGAPSRFRIALRTGTVSTLEEKLAEARPGRADRAPVHAAQLLLELVAHLDEHDALTRGHSERVRAYAQSIGRELGLAGRDLDLLNWAALLHDIGKLDVPHEILTKSGRPTEEEWEILRGHPSAGARLAAPLREWLGDWSSAIEEHHERWDGGGYPRGLAGTEISLAGRIVAVADVFDVITSSRSYKQSGSVAEARQELARCAGAQFDPEVVRAFLAISVRQGRLAAPLAWLAHATVLLRVPVTPAGGLSAGAAAVAVGAGLGVGMPAQPVVQASPPLQAHSVAAGRSTTPPAAPRPRERPAAKPSRTEKKAPRARPRGRLEPVAAPAPKAAAARPRSVEREPVAEIVSSAESTKPPPKPEPAPAAPPETFRPAPVSKTAVGPLASPTPSPPAPPREVPAVTLPHVPGVPPSTGAGPLTETVTSLTEDLNVHLGTVTDDVTSVTEDAVAVADPGTPVSEDVSAIVDDVSSLASDVTSILGSPPGQTPPPPPAEPQPPGDADDPSPTLVEGLLSALDP
jgi:putative nucleotidyltransferase with HDIG domain